MNPIKSNSKECEYTKLFEEECEKIKQQNATRCFIGLLMGLSEESIERSLKPEFN